METQVLSKILSSVEIKFGCCNMSKEAELINHESVTPKACPQLSAALTAVLCSVGISFTPDLNWMFTPSSVLVYQSKSHIWSIGHLGAQSDEHNTADVARVVCELVWPSLLSDTLMAFFYFILFYECYYLLSVVSELTKNSSGIISTFSAAR